MKEEKDILDVFTESFDQGIPVGESIGKRFR